MIQRTVPVTELRGVPDRPFEVLARPPDRLVNGPSQRELRRRRRGEGAPGPVRVPRRNARSAQVELLLRRAHRVNHQVAGRTLVEVATLHDYDARAQRMDPAR